MAITDLLGEGQPISVHPLATLCISYYFPANVPLFRCTETRLLLPAECGLVALCMRRRSVQGHTGVVNSCCISRTGNLVASGSDDGFVKLWDPRVRRSVAEFMNQYQVTAVCLSRDDQQVMSGGIDNDIKVFDVRKLDIAYTMTGHKDTVTGEWGVGPTVVFLSLLHASQRNNVARSGD